MKHTSLISRLHFAALSLLLATAGPALAGWESNRFGSRREIFVFADKNNDGNINPDERDALRIAFLTRGDLHLLDTNKNGKLNKEEIDAFELIYKTSKTDKKKKKEKEERRKKLENRWKKNR